MAEMVTSEGKARRYIRRAFSIPLALSIAPLMLIMSPIVFPVLALIDLITAPRRFPLTRLGAMALAFAAHEWMALAFYLRVLTRGAEDRFEFMREAMGTWTASLLHWVGITLGAEVDWGDLDTMPSGHPLIIARHASNVDAIIPAILFAKYLKRPAHHVLKHDLRWALSMDLFAPPLGNYFVVRGKDTQAELRQLERLAELVRPEGSLVIFPEGTFATDAKRKKIRASLERKGELEAVALTDELQALLPPKPAGVLTLLAARPDVVPMVLAHRGLDNVASFKGLWTSVPLQQPIVVRWWPTAAPPSDPDEQVRWLQNEWRRADLWVRSSDQMALEPNH
ncbi:MAG: 1-acyl-sn-glycerol-3-phosphate acyltransferase [Acidimicrobiales bacterium]